MFGVFVDLERKYLGGKPSFDWFGTLVKGSFGTLVLGVVLTALGSIFNIALAGFGMMVVAVSLAALTFLKLLSEFLVFFR